MKESIEEKKKNMELCLEGLANGLSKDAIARKIGRSDTYVFKLIKQMETMPGRKGELEEARIWGKFCKWANVTMRKSHESYLKKLTIYMEELPLYQYIVDHHATYRMASAHFGIVNGAVERGIARIKKVSPAAEQVLSMIAEDNIHNTHRIQGIKREGAANEAQWMERSLTHIHYIIENNCSIQDAKKCYDATISQISLDVYRMLNMDDSSIKEKALLAYQIIASHMDGVCSYIDYKGKVYKK